MLHSYNEVLKATAGCWFGYFNNNKTRYLNELNKHRTDITKFLETLFDTRVKPILKDGKLQWKCDIGGMDGRATWIPHHLLVQYLEDEVEGEKSFQSVTTAIKAHDDDSVLRPVTFDFGNIADE